jgi:DNA-binding NarL/FixJ family response regulator
MKREIAARSVVAVVQIWPLERAVATGADADTSLVVLDGFPSAAALRTMADVTSSRPELGVLVIGPVDPSVEILVAVASGALGYLPAPSTPAAVADAVEALLAGGAVLPHAVSLLLVQHLRWGGRGIEVNGLDRGSAVLTIREWEVLVQLRQARTTAEIAKHLVVSNATVRSHVAALLHKLGARDRSELTSPSTSTSRDSAHRD